MLMLITLLNDGTLISIGYDRVLPNPRPDKWNLRVRTPLLYPAPLSASCTMLRLYACAL
jgi:H+-transporting ATPase